jgi:hypothetical protein
MSIENLWGEFSPEESIQTPVGVLREQASILTEKAKGIIAGEVENGRTADGQLSHTLKIVAPSLGGYSYSVVRVLHPIALYPGLLIDYSNEKRYNFASEDEFVSILKSALSGSSLIQVIRALIAQSKG